MILEVKVLLPQRSNQIIFFTIFFKKRLLEYAKEINFQDISFKTFVCCEFFPLKRFGDALFAPNYGCYDLIVDTVLFISATRLVLASSLYLQTLTRANVI